MTLQMAFEFPRWLYQSSHRHTFPNLHFIQVAVTGMGNPPEDDNLTTAGWMPLNGTPYEQFDWSGSLKTSANSKLAGLLIASPIPLL